VHPFQRGPSEQQKAAQDDEENEGEVDEDEGAEGAGGGDALVVLRILDKMGRGKEPAEGSLPEKGERVCWTLFEHEQRGGPKLPEPEETPWTHGGPPGTGAESPDTVTSEDVL